MALTFTLALLFLLTVAGSSSCSQPPRSAAPARHSLGPVPPGWQRTDLGRFSLFLPPDMKMVEVKSIDSSVWEFRKEGYRLTIDLGVHSDDLSTYNDWPDFHQENVKVDSRTGKLCTFRHAPNFMDSVDGDRVYIAALYFADIGFGENRLTFWLTSNTVQGQQSARTIFYSIKFK